MNISSHLKELHAGAESVWLACQERAADLKIEVVAEIGSTNTELMERARQGRLDRVLMLAAHQTAGRGRMGRQWHDEPGRVLMFSLGMPFASPPASGLALAVGVSLAEQVHPQLRLKWPNDLWWNDAGQWRKVGGILVEATQVKGESYVVVGVGINLLAYEVVGGHANAIPAGSLAEMGACENTADLLTRMIPALMSDMERFMAEGFGAFVRRFEAVDALLGREVSVPNGVSGVATGVRDDGALCVRSGDQVEAIYSQEVSVRPC